jgi:hypothetical protein
LYNYVQHYQEEYEDALDKLENAPPSLQISLCESVAVVDAASSGAPPRSSLGGRE